LAILSGSGSSDPGGVPLWNAVFGRLAELGFHEGRNLVVERRFAEGLVERLPALAAEIVALQPDVILAITTPPSLAAARATSTIPIVFAAVSDPVGVGLVRSLARTGNNVTGASSQNSEIQSKRLQLVREIFPSASQVAVLYNPLNVAEPPIVATLQEAARTFGFVLRLVGAKSEQDLRAAFETLEAKRPDVLYVIESQFTFLHRGRIIESTNRMHLPGVYGLSQFADAGGLMSYSFSLLDVYRAAANYVDKILRGAKPADLPVGQPTTFELVLNLRTATAQGVVFPPNVLLRADRVVK
jgi:putative ABC transport system substrate-binding protein